jgi:hypothetical protein
MKDITAGQAGAALVLTTLLILYVVGMLWGFIKRPRIQSIIELVMLLGVMYVGWIIRTWPTRQSGDGMLMSLGMAWRDSVITLLYLAARMIGLVEVWEWIMRFFH